MKFSPRALAAWLLPVLSMVVLAMSAGGSPSVAQDSQTLGLDAETTDKAPERQLVLRFVTEGDFPPFNFYDEDGQLTGFNVDLARSICLEAAVACDIQVKPWDELMLTLRRGESDAVIAGHRITAKSVQEADFSTPYLYTPGRFAVRHNAEKLDISPEGLQGQRIGVIRGSAHEAFLKTFFRDSRIEVHPSSESAREAMVNGKLDYLFDDGISLSFWLNGTLSQQCCEFRGGPFLESKFFGDGIAIAVKKGDRQTRELINRSIASLRESGRFEEIIGRYFPYRIY
ncbi:MAG: transporter substrate-binding domain-containing protein [Hyphomicrobiaceae bacterium]|nr:transporter substrate-binding domain-containing protein [Hyphomicrobiaceae bacterium]MCC0011177.1 transporter substrate-binding domain-containing protein [Hyphomicrobiaceae bacterium]